MSRRRIVILVAAAAALTGPLLLAPTQTTGAYWNEELILKLPQKQKQTQSDVFSMTAGDVRSDVDHSQPVPGGPNALTDVANEPRVSITNNSKRHTSWIDVVSTRVAIPALPGGDPLANENNLLNKVKVAYAVSDACTDTFTSTYWAVNGAGRVAAGSPGYTRPTLPPVESAQLPAGQTRAVCPWVQPDNGVATRPRQRAFLMEHAGRQLDIFTTVRQKSFGEGTWTSNQAADVRSRYQVKLPPPTRRSEDSVVCARTRDDGSWGGVGAYGRLYWAWPFAADGETEQKLGNTSPTPAINRFVLIRSVDGLNDWKPFRKSKDQTSGDVYGTDGNPSGEKRLSESIDANYLANDGKDPVYLSVRAYPYAGTDVYVDADWKVQVYQKPAGFLRTKRFYCLSDGAEVDVRAPGVNRTTSLQPVGLD